MPIGSFTSNRNINATTPHATPITVCQRPPRRRPLHPGPAVVACRKSLARKESRRGLSHPRSSPHTQRIAESKRAAPFVEWGLQHRQLRGVAAIGVDEIHWGRGLRADNFLTVIYQIDAGCRRLLWVGKRRSQATLRRGLKALGPE